MDSFRGFWSHNSSIHTHWFKSLLPSLRGRTSLVAKKHSFTPSRKRFARFNKFIYLPYLRGNFQFYHHQWTVTMRSRLSQILIFILPYPVHGKTTRNQFTEKGKSTQELFSSYFYNISLSTSSQGQVQEITTEPADGFLDPYLAILDIYTSENLNLYNKAIVGLPESDRYDLTRSKWTKFYQ